MLRARPRFRRLSRGQLTRRINLPLSSVGPGCEMVGPGSAALTNAARQTADVGVIRVLSFEAEQLWATLQVCWRQRPRVHSRASNRTMLRLTRRTAVTSTAGTQRTWSLFTT